MSQVTSHPCTCNRQGRTQSRPKAGSRGERRPAGEQEPPGQGVGGGWAGLRRVYHGFRLSVQALDRQCWGRGDGAGALSLAG